MSEHEITIIDDAVEIIRNAIDAKVDHSSLRELLAVRREWQADEARKAYYSAISEFQRRAPIIAKGDDAHGKKYAALDRIWRTIRPLAGELGLTVTWQACELRDGLCHVEGTLAHVSGHCTPIVADTALPELIRGQNLAQQTGSAETYAKRRALCSALGIVTGEDDDGEAAGTKTITREQADRLREQADQVTDPHEVDRWFGWLGAKDFDEVPAAMFGKAEVALGRIIAKQGGAE